MLFGQEKTMDTKILLVEDDTMLNEGIAYALRKKEYLVYSAKNIEEASGYMNQPVSLVILDINLPDGDGRMFLKHIRQSNTVPVLLCRMCSGIASDRPEYRGGYAAGI